MGNTWYCIPSKRPPAEAEKCLSKWRERGYKIALWRDLPASSDKALLEREWLRQSDMQCTFGGDYPGYAQAVNRLVREVLDNDPACDWVVTGGDDVYPDPNYTADEIAAQCTEHFRLYVSTVLHSVPWSAMATFGVMQCTADRWGDDAASRAKWPDAPAMIDRICGSPWMGREFCERINQGTGPLWHEYPHSWVDEELQNVAIKYGCFWQRRDLCHYHDHCTRNGGEWAPHLRHVPADYTRMKPLFEARKKMGFPGSDPL